MAELNLEHVQAAKDTIAETQVTLTEHMHIVINSESFLLSVDNVLSVLRPVALTPVPMAPDHLMGMANVRGQIFCIIDPGKALRLSQKRKAETSESRFLLLRHPRVHLGIWAEQVLGLVRLSEAEKDVSDAHDYEAGKVDTEFGALPILRVEALFD